MDRAIDEQRQRHARWILLLATLLVLVTPSPRARADETSPRALRRQCLDAVARTCQDGDGPAARRACLSDGTSGCLAVYQRALDEGRATAAARRRRKL